MLTQGKSVSDILMFSSLTEVIKGDVTFALIFYLVSVHPQPALLSEILFVNMKRPFLPSELVGPANDSFSAVSLTVKWVKWS